MTADEQIIANVLAGDRAAFSHLVTRYQDRLYGMLLRLTGSDADAQEVAQDAFVQAFVKLDRFQGRSGFYTWLYRIAFNLWASRARKQRAAVSIDQHREASGFDPAGTLDTPLDNLESAERVDAVRAALTHLPADARAILLLREMEDCDYETIAERLAIPVGTVRSRLHRARLTLKRILEREYKQA